MLSNLAQHLKLPDLWQHQAVDHLRAGADVIVDAPTGAGKTYIFEILHESRCLKGQSVYTVPTRALANDKYAEWKKKGWDVGIATGDVSENIDAPVVVATLETQLERLLRGQGPACLVIDEYQMISDAGRGAHYEGAIALAPNDTRLLLLSGSVANPNDLADWMRSLDRKVEVVVTRERPVPLEEMPVEMLPGHRGQKFEGWWPKLVASVLMADLAPLLIFSPRRKDAEAIARSLANELPMGEPLSLTPEQRNVCGKELSHLIEKRIAYHHSGLSYAARAGVIEPLAKAGQLRVIAATMGLAAGINFSVRSVHVAATKFHNGISEMTLEPDELLQMFGRAGRRGLDERGYVITTRQSPSLHDARPARLHRSGVLAWPMFLRVMRHAALRNDSPFVAAERFAARLFAKDPPPLGLETNASGAATFDHVQLRDGVPIFGLDAVDEQILSSAGKWETWRPQRERTVKLGDAWIATEQKQCAALEDANFVNGLRAGIARVFRQQRSYGLEVALGTPITDTVFKPTRSMRKLLKLNHHVQDVSLDEFASKHQHKIGRVLVPEALVVNAHRLAPNELPQFIDYLQREGLFLARYELSRVPVKAYADSHGRPLLNPKHRSVRRESSTTIEVDGDDSSEPVRCEPKQGSAIHSWRALGLIDARGVPTLRGEIVSFFQHGEGLAIASALEDDTYPVSDLVEHMANLRAGSRFELIGYCDSERLGASCRRAYGFVSHHGYLINGLPTDYGDGAAEVIAALLSRDRRNLQAVQENFAEGDVSRVYIEWVSLIRHVVHAPRHEWHRWRELQDACDKALLKHSKLLRHLFHLDLPQLTAKQQQTKVRHYLLPK